LFLSLVLQDYRIPVCAQLLVMIVIAGRLSLLGFVFKPVSWLAGDSRLRQTLSLRIHLVEQQSLSSICPSTIISYLRSLEASLTTSASSSIAGPIVFSLDRNKPVTLVEILPKLHINSAQVGINSPPWSMLPRRYTVGGSQGELFDPPRKRMPRTPRARVSRQTGTGISEPLAARLVELIITGNHPAQKNSFFRPFLSCHSLVLVSIISHYQSKRKSRDT